MRHTLRLALAFILLSVLQLGTPDPARAAISVTKLGNPIWQPTDFHLFSAPIGIDGADFLAVLQTILPPPNHVPNPVLGIGPGAPHAGPYDQEIGQGVSAAGYHQSDTFSVSEFSGGNGVVLAFMLIPGAGAPTGSSPDFMSGPIIPNGIFPLNATTDTFTNGVLNDTGSFQIPAIDQAGFPGLAGHSHIPFFTADSFDFTSFDALGAYEYRTSILDDGSNGYQIVASFELVPEPATWMIALTNGLILGGVVVARRVGRAGG